MIPGSSRLVKLAVAGAVALIGSATLAATFPSKRITFIVGYPPGGTADRTARVLAEVMGRELGQPAIVENKNGASQTIAAAALLNAPADGHTLLLVAEIDFVSKVSTDKSLKFNLSEFRSVCGTATTPYLGAVVRKDARWQSIDELVAEMKAKPGTLTWGTAGEATGHYRTMELLQKEAHVKVVHVPYTGGGPAIVDLLGGQIDVMGGTYALWRPHLEAGKVRALLIQGDKRIADLPGVPTYADKNWSTALKQGWMRLLVHKSTPEESFGKLAAACQALEKDAKAKDVLKTGGAEPVVLGPAEAEKLAADDEASIPSLSQGATK